MCIQKYARINSPIVFIFISIFFVQCIANVIFHPSGVNKIVILYISKFIQSVIIPNSSEIILASSLSYCILYYYQNKRKYIGTSFVGKNSLLNCITQSSAPLCGTFYTSQTLPKLVNVFSSREFEQACTIYN